ncbi:MAG: hypothetical protein QGM50_09140 [Anaerolineae bacterium]|nr:hypothetical protein [Anaerolineae bacterium]MDK1081794.1 hypothetical protein [Anaerolineae bacterium]MDK1118939.1 hypothetical protein [Anaerolineae bacterium]
MTEAIVLGERVKIFLESKFWNSAGWVEGTVVRIDPYSRHRRFYWVELDQEVQSTQGDYSRLISVFNPKNLMKI